MKMTKKQMVEYIEKSGMILDFNFNRIMRYNKNRIEYFYNMAIEYNKKRGRE